ncbi:MAG TPA: flavodoxin-dependent (E)-4-hydroxy-3-methylbut-2-enyl-diphosphate synthase [Firmicutes bacterium]|nr:flavodoxin-dependent (E)-4-hydroxy-3-methylbut-2-enyl-diphosphate synthase [Bacillota bacterium]
MPGVERRMTRQVKVRNVLIGGGAPISVQSMTKTDTRDREATLAQVLRLTEAGCDIVRLAIPDEDAARSLAWIRKHTDAALVADIHFDYRLGLLAIESGADKIRVNPGNIPQRGLKELAAACRANGVPVRVGVNSGSIAREILSRHGGLTVAALVESALQGVRLVEDAGVTDIVISLKATDPLMTIQAYREISNLTDRPLHLGLTESGAPRSGTVRSAVTLGVLLAGGIGDTIRVSLTGDPVEEVRVGLAILRSLGLREGGVEIISCPTCGRCSIGLDRLAGIASEVERGVSGIRAPLKIAIMGCEVNGPGEAREADVGLAVGRGRGLLFVRGKPVRQVDEKEFVKAILDEVRRIVPPEEG